MHMFVRVGRPQMKTCAAGRAEGRCLMSWKGDFPRQRSAAKPRPRSHEAAPGFQLLRVALCIHMRLHREDQFEFTCSICMCANTDTRLKEKL